MAWGRRLFHGLRRRGSVRSPAPSKASGVVGDDQSGGGFGTLDRIQMITALFLNLVQSCVMMPMQASPAAAAGDMTGDGESS